MKILFIYPDISYSIPYYQGSVSFGLISISAELKSRGNTASLLHITRRDFSREELLDKVQKSSCDLIAVSAVSNMFPYVTRYVLWIKDRFQNLPVICGGIHPTVVPEQTISVEGIDMLCIGEGEGPMVELCDALEHQKDIRSIKNIWVKDNGTVHKNPIRPLIKDLNTLAFYDWDLFDMKSLHESPEGVGNYLASRGCPYQCTYCANNRINKMYTFGKNSIRLQSVPRIITEIKILLEKHPFIKYLVFQDDILVKNKTWFEEFAHEFKTKIGIPYICNGRPEYINEATVELMKSSGCARVWVGIESGDEEIRKKVLKRFTPQKKIIDIFALLHKYGLSTQTFNMIGIPYEDRKKVLETIKLNAKIRPTGMQATIFHPYPGTELYEICEKEGFLTDRAVDDYHTQSTINLPTISQDEIEFFKRGFRIFVKLYIPLFKYKFPGNNLLMKLLDSILTSKYFPYKLSAFILRTLFSILRSAHGKFFRKYFPRRARHFS